MKIEKLVSKDPKGKIWPVWCQGEDCKGANTTLARYKMTIIDYPAGFYCSSCVKSMEKIWDDALFTDQEAPELAA